MTPNSRAGGAAPTAAEALAHIDRLAVFCGWPAALKARLAAAARIVGVGRGETVLRCGETCTELIVVLEGTLVTCRSGPDGRQSVMSYWQPHDILGLAPIFGGGAFSFDLHAPRPARLMTIPAARILEAVADNPRLVGGLLEVTYHRYRLTIEMFCRQTLMPLRERMIDRLLFLADTQGRAAADGSVRLDIRLSQENLAAMLSATRQSVNKELRRLVDAQVIALAYNSVTITDLERLRELARPHALPPLTAPEPLSSPLAQALAGASTGS